MKIDLKINPVYQGDNTYCVPYSLYSITKYYKLELTKEQIIKSLNSSYWFGTDLDNVKKLEEFNLKFHRIAFNFETIALVISEKIPIVFSYESDKEEHCSVISGVKIKNKQSYLIISDPLYGVYEIPYDAMKTLWNASSKFIRAVEKVSSK